MSKSIVAVKDLEPVVGKSVFYTVKNGEVLSIDKFPENVIFIMNCIKVTQDDKEITLGDNQDGKRFVPSFELAKSANEFILNWFAEATEDYPAIKLRGVIDIQALTVSVTGEGFESAEIEVVEYKEPGTTTSEDSATTNTVSEQKSAE